MDLKRIIFSEKNQSQKYYIILYITCSSFKTIEMEKSKEVAREQGEWWVHMEGHGCIGVASGSSFVMTDQF